ncbi:zinc finger protein RFP-like [Pelodiscus sinensis]|uniref:zinc finger protein RFP-like n=1 Tax=Pelodiscus sinensis TaxID=13735 RepID=UPI003F6D4A7B
MAAGDLAGSFQDEVTCPICLEYFTDPVTIECGHNFCRACLSRCWGESEPNFSCPQCRETIPQRHLRPNYQLGNLVELVKRLRLPVGPAPQGQPGCERHQEALKLFCQEDQDPICVICRESRAHRAHTAVPIEEAAQECKEQILSCLQRLREERDALRGLESDWAEESERLLGVRSAVSRGEAATSPHPAPKCPELEQRIRDFPGENSLQGAVTGFLGALAAERGLRRARGFAVDVTLDPDTAHPKLVLSEDRKRVRHGDTRQDLPDNPERFDPCPCVLGAEGFTGGRGYWEVEVGDKTGWDLGVCRESVSRKGKITYTPGDGCWVVVLRDGGYKACTSPWTPLPVSARPSRVGVFLDYEAGEVSFYNVTDGSHLFTFTGTFSGTLRPYFSPFLNAGGTNAAPLTICPVPAQAGGNPCP